MNKERIHRNREEILEKYLRNELSERETENFEEHLFSCAKCRAALAQRSEILESMEKYAAAKVFQTSGASGKSRRITSRALWYVSAAAGVAMILGIFLLPLRNRPQSISESRQQVSEGDSLGAFESKEDPVAFQTDTNKLDRSKLENRRIAYQEAFQTNPIFESQLGVHTRSLYLVVDSPADSIQCKPGSSIEIKYRGMEEDSLFLAFLNNRGEILFEEGIISGYILHVEYPGGLYYWQLSDEEEALHTGKILIR